MSKETKLQEMQRRLNVGELNQKEKKGMFEKLTKAGGQVIDLETGKTAGSRHRSGGIMRPAPQNAKQPPAHSASRPEAAPPNAAEAPRRTAHPAPPPARSAEAPKLKIPSAFTLVGYQVNGFFSWIFDFGARRFRQRYIRLVIQDYQNALIQLNTSLLPLYNGSFNALELRKNMYKTNNLIEYELGYHFCKLFDAQKFSVLQKQIPLGVLQSKEVLKGLYNDLNYLRSHATHAKVALPLLLRRFVQLFPKSAPKDFSSARIAKAMNVIWEQFFLETNLLILYYWVDESRRTRREMSLDQFLNAPPLSPVGAMADDLHAMLEAQEMEQQASPQDEESGDSEAGEGKPEVYFPTDDIQFGMDFILNHVRFQELHARYRSGNDLRALFALNDKLFYAYALVDYFDGEFTFLWAGNYINFYVLSEASGGRYDPKKELLLLNGRLNHFYEQTNEYLRQYRSYQELAKSAGGGTQRVIQLENKEKDLNFLSFTARTTLVKIMEEYELHLKRILKSKDSPDSTIGNWGDVIGVSVKAGRKFLSDMTISEALVCITHAVEAMRWVLSKSDLSGMGNQLVAPVVIPYPNAKIEKMEGENNKP